MKTDKRARLTLKGNASNAPPLQGPARELKQAEGVLNGLVFPLTPTITFQRSANYGNYDLPHTNYQPKYYAGTSSPSVQVTGLFTNNTREEALYTAGVIHFLRMCSLMHFGEDDPHRGTPPPICLFSAYGVNMFQNFPCVVANVSYTLDSDMEYVQVMQGNMVNGLGPTESTLPSQMFIAIDLQHMPDPLAMRKRFSIDRMASGQLLSEGFN
tara:strand:+ start:9745 stop:10380 length:636 start_codon:yes stop_codon:yes gene_type:complete